MTTKYTIKKGDTLAEIAKAHGITLAALQAANPGVKPESLQIGQVINIPGGSSPPASGGIPGATGGTNGGGGYVNYSGPASKFPPKDQWASYHVLWESNSRLMKYHDSDTEIGYIKEGIEKVAKEGNLDVRAILCTIMQETGGNVRAKTTSVEVRNPGLMQSHNGVEFNPNDPKGSILQMIRDGSTGTKDGDGLKQLLAKYGNYYEAFRGYNSGTVDKNNLNNGGPATPDYVQKIANRLMGHTWPNM